jgi:Secretion system C-terminal sorting domain
MHFSHHSTIFILHYTYSMKYLLVLLFFTVPTSFAQVMQPTLLSVRGIGGNGNDGVGSVVKTADGGFILNIGSSSTHGIGNIDSFCDVDGYRNIFIKYNSDAITKEWQRCFRWDGDTVLPNIFPQSDGGLILAGDYTSDVGWGIYICKQDASGSILWSHGYSYGNNLFLNKIVSTEDGGYLIAGTSYYIDTNVLSHYGSWTNPDIFLLKLDSIGNKVWTKVIGGSDYENVHSIICSTNNIYVIGETYSIDYDCIGNHGKADIFVAKLDKVGNILWHKDIGGSENDAAVNAVMDYKENIIIAGYTFSSDGDVTKGSGLYENFLVTKVDSSGNILWNNCYGSTNGNCNPYDICKSTNNDLWIVGLAHGNGGFVNKAFGSNDAWIVHTDSGGNFLNAKVLGSHKEDRAQVVFPLENNHVLVGGFYDTSDGSFSTNYYGDEDAFLAEFTSENETFVRGSLSTGSIKVTPNPASDKIKIELGTQGKKTVTISNIIGKVVFSSYVENQLTISVSEWTPGLYYIALVSTNGYKYFEKIIIQ